MSDTTKAGFSSHRLAKIVPALEERYVSRGLLPGGELHILRGGEVILAAASGMMDRERQRPWRADALVRIYSMTKPVVSAALMSLWEEGCFHLDQPVQDLLPAWRDQRVWVSGEGADMETVAVDQPVTFRHLLTHTAGLTYGATLSRVGGARTEDPAALAYADARPEAVGAAYGLAAYAEAVGHLPLRFQPGTRWAYSHATDVLGGLIERLSGQRLDDFLAERIFDPLSMGDTGFHARSSERLAACYGVAPEGPVRLIDDPETSALGSPPAFLSGGGGLVSTARDYLRFAEALRNGGVLDGRRILAPRTIRLMTQNHLPGGRDLTDVALISNPALVPRGVGFGLGVAVTTDAMRAGLPSDGDWYWSGAANTHWWVDPREALTVVFMAQVTPTPAYRLQDELKALIYGAMTDAPASR